MRNFAREQEVVQQPQILLLNIIKKKKKCIHVSGTSSRCVIGQVVPVSWLVRTEQQSDSSWVRAGHFVTLFCWWFLHIPVSTFFIFYLLKTNVKNRTLTATLQRVPTGATVNVRSKNVCFSVWSMCLDTAGFYWVTSGVGPEESLGVWSETVAVIVKYFTHDAPDECVQHEEVVTAARPASIMMMQVVQVGVVGELLLYQSVMNQQHEFLLESSVLLFLQSKMERWKRWTCVINWAKNIRMKKINISVCWNYGNFFFNALRPFVEFGLFSVFLTVFLWQLCVLHS